LGSLTVVPDQSRGAHIRGIFYDHVAITPGQVDDPDDRAAAVLAVLREADDE
jgi:hypothetical protein